ncbi:MAG: glycosyltransferase [Bryobacteraceae bacterium]
MSPKVSFVVPCYRLAHLLPECVTSILSQTYRDLEVLIMDDCSPDDTSAVAGSFKDDRVRYIRNEQNLGHLRNYNKGIELSHGEYVWLISADDRLRVPYLLQRYIDVMDSKAEVGFACCPAVMLDKGLETNIEGQIVKHDRIFRGEEFLTRLLKGNFVIAASGMVRRVSYEKCGTFPSDLPYAGDWYLWCLFALHYDVAYFAEPMVNYRTHDLSMTNYLMNYRSALALAEGFSVLSRILHEAQRVRKAEIAKQCEYRLARLYGNHLAGGECGGCVYHMTESEFENSLNKEDLVAAEETRIRARAWAAAGDCSFRLHNLSEARAQYRRALQHDRSMLGIRMRQLLLSTGGFGIALMEGFRRLRNLAFS